MNIRTNEWSKLHFVDPSIILPELRELQLRVASSSLDGPVKNLRPNNSKQYREGWEAALFCFGMSKIIGVPIHIALYEASDYDAVAMRIQGEIQHFTPIQIKEVVPGQLNPNTDINSVIAKLTRYKVSNDTVVVIHVNRTESLQLTTIKVPELNIASLWLMGASEPDQNKWFLAGNMLEKPQIFEFDYPVVQ